MWIIERRKLFSKLITWLSILNLVRYCNRTDLWIFSIIIHPEALALQCTVLLMINTYRFVTGRLMRRNNIQPLNTTVWVWLYCCNYDTDRVITFVRYTQSRVTLMVSKTRIDVKTMIVRLTCVWTSLFPYQIKMLCVFYFQIVGWIFSFIGSTLFLTPRIIYQLLIKRK